MFLVVGLGNPGDQYAGNRHNIGFMAVDEIVRRHSFAAWRAKYQGLLTEGDIGGERVLMLKPMTFMNNSGRSVGECARFYKIPPENVIILHDELELPPGKLRLKQGGGHAGHNGLRDIDAHFDNNTLRVRLGIGRPHDKALVHNWVLSNFAKADQDWLDTFLDAVARNFRLIVKGDHAGFMNRVSLATQPPRPKKEKPPAGRDPAGPNTEKDA
ncbi:MAG: peptidyl-tRNA hydrolase [Rhodospirillaceae bacterium BRH_c57]|nr:MAG: peptidyl-tRNA hydrolase [Rhodospirillaceae bacterium BRH_c57]